MTITSTRKVYAISNSSDANSLNGELNIQSDGLYNISGSITNGTETSNFYYSVDLNSKINKSINNVSESNETTFNTLLDSTIEEIRTELADKTIG